MGHLGRRRLRAGDTVVLGVAGGFFRSNMDFERFGGVSGGSIEYDGGQIAGYGGWDNSVWYDRAIVSAGFYDGESHRNFALIARRLTRAAARMLMRCRSTTKLGAGSRSEQRDADAVRRHHRCSRGARQLHRKRPAKHRARR